MPKPLYYPRPDVVSVPRAAQWYAWTYLIAPATAPLYLASDIFQEIDRIQVRKHGKGN